MNEFGDARVRNGTLLWMALLAADNQEQLTWLEERELETEPVVEEVELLCRLSEGFAERGVLEPGQLRELQAVGRRLGDIDAARRTGLWADALATDPAWDDVRLLARRFLVSTLGDWRQPLPRPVRPHNGGH
ncbi:hypothetical protein ACF07V_35175 [Streptomyces sp. NPDC015661]|uniref:hypothetical protein n=1 Tax=Streptomyces sp. NPDC015661 TaxID=3364961 RepID=UPI0036FD5905